MCAPFAFDSLLADELEWAVNRRGVPIPQRHSSKVERKRLNYEYYVLI